jgi:predicted DNA-binding transcriptional regulator AlpA
VPEHFSTAPIDEFLMKKELAALCRCSERTIDRLIEQGEAPPLTRLSARRVIFPKAAALEWLRKRTSGIAEASSPPMTPRRRGRPPKRDDDRKVLGQLSADVPHGDAP